MSKIKVDDRVIAIENGEIKKAIVKGVYDNIVVIDFGEGYLDKRRINDLALEPVQKSQEVPEKPTEPVEKSEIAITQRDFENASNYIINDLLVFIGDEKAELLSRFSAILSNQLFSASPKND